ncbi:hypothetical protein RI367_008042 [Sorochytrium milnesiophthora]
MTAKIAPITGMLRRKFLFDLTGSLVLGTAGGYAFWYGYHVKNNEIRAKKLRELRIEQNLPVADHNS